jgi:hypothetical protein
MDYEQSNLLSKIVATLLRKQLKEIEDRVTEKMLERVNLFRPDRETEERITNRVLERTAHSANTVISLISTMGKPFWELTEEMQWLLATGSNFSEAKLIRYLPVRIYLKRTIDAADIEIDAANAIASILGSLLEECFIPATEFPVERGSAWKRFWVKTREKWTQHEAEEKITAALELQTLDKPQAETTKLLAEGASAILKELASIDNACIQIGNALIVKRTIDGKSLVSVKTLSPLQLKRLEEDTTVLFDPQRALTLLTP